MFILRRVGIKKYHRMPRGTNRRGRGRRGNLSRAVRRIERPIQRRRDFGCKHDPGPRPRNHVVAPWVAIVCELGGKVDTTFSPNAILNSLRQQQGYFTKTGTVETNLPMDIRFTGFKLWSLTVSRPLALQVYDFRSRTSDVFQRLMGWPSYNQFARVGFWLPDFMKDLVFDDTDTTTKVIAIDHGSGSWLCYVYCLVRPTNTEKIGQMTDRYNELFSDFEKISLSE